MISSSPPQISNLILDDSVTNIELHTPYTPCVIRSSVLFLLQACSAGIKNSRIFSSSSFVMVSCDGRGTISSLISSSLESMSIRQTLVRVGSC
ncbi:unnamed protein product [Moneuplotes crassus]|uniref:Uncharacterized protein n=1 Tax=Euplotes crassus TaxID=5936 RepID=A0AAD1U1W5_EUPCR|nr:unnamed protein product [Moneuplotes crassus]